MTEPDENRGVRFGEFVLDPREEQVVGPAGEVRIGRKAFRLLQELLGHPGSLLTKTRLFETVWDGTVVTEAALTATVKELRRALGDEAKSPRYIESVYGRGYRFVAPVSAAPAVPPKPRQGESDTAPAGLTASRSPLSRRAMIGWGIAAGGGLAIAGVAARIALSGFQPSPYVAELIANARQLMDQNTRAGQNQAIGLLRRVTTLAPDFADGWGWLGIAYGVPSHFRERPEALMMRARARAAGDRALELDRGSAYGELARAVELPFIGHWLERDRRLARAQADRPGNDDVLEYLALASVDVGRASAAALFYERIKRRPFTPAMSGGYVRALWNAGRIEDAERVLGDAIALYPTQATLWFERFELSLFGGKPDAAAAMVADASGRPTGVDDALAADLSAWAEAIRSPGSPTSRRTLVRLLGQAHEDSLSAQCALRVAAALGDRDAAFAVADAYYFGEGFRVPDLATPGSAASTDQRETCLLFNPEIAPLRADPRFERLVAKLGLNTYWREADVFPDYRVG